jgi:uncharacterized protein (DUF697 family)
VIFSLQAAMIKLLADEHSIIFSKTAATELLLTFVACFGGRSLSEVLVGWIPVWGNVVNASTAFTLTEAIGWAAHAYFTEECPVDTSVSRREPAQQVVRATPNSTCVPDAAGNTAKVAAGNGIARTSAFPSSTWERGEAQARNATVPSTPLRTGCDRRDMNNTF